MNTASFTFALFRRSDRQYVFKTPRGQWKLKMGEVVVGIEASGEAPNIEQFTTEIRLERIPAKNAVEIVGWFQSERSKFVYVPDPIPLIECLEQQLCRLT